MYKIIDNYLFETRLFGAENFVLNLCLGNYYINFKNLVKILNLGFKRVDLMMLNNVLEKLIFRK